MKTILLVEDDPFISEVYSVQFKKEGYKVDVARDCEIASERIKEKTPDLLILDIDFGAGEMNGLEFLSILRDDAKTKNAKVVVLSNYNVKSLDEKYNIDITRLGISDFFLKAQTSVEELASSIKKILK